MTDAAALFAEAFGDDPGAALEAIERSRRIPAGEGEVVGVPAASFAGLRGDPPAPLSAEALSGEMTNRSWRLGDRFVLKIYDRLAPGPHPELELLGELTGLKIVPPLAGWLEYSKPGDDPAVAGLLAGWIPDARNAWDVAREDPERLRGLTRRLARKTAEMHLALEDAPGSAFRREPLDAAYLRALFTSMVGHAEEILGGSGGEAADLLPLARACFDRVPALRPGGSRTRTHGDYHLGQVLLWEGDFLVIDFEGEPDRPLAERRAKHSPLRDVAGMLRSFEYLADGGGENWLPDSWSPEIWRMRVEEQFLKEYLEVAGVGSFLPPRETVDGLLKAFRLEKAIYELRYELAHRPDWAGIPLAGIRRILFRES